MLLGGIFNAGGIGQARSVPSGSDRVGIVGYDKTVAYRTNIADLQNHVSWKLALDVEIEVVDIRNAIRRTDGAHIKLGIVTPIERGTWVGERVWEWIGFRPVSCNISEWIGKCRAAGEACVIARCALKICRSARSLEDRRLTQVLQLAFFDVAVVIEPEASAYRKPMLPRPTNQP